MSPARSVNRNAPCPCGSGRKYKNCCLRGGGGGGGGPRPGPAARSAGGTAGPLEAAQAEHRAGHREAAARLYRQALRRNRRETRALLGLGQIMEESGDLKHSARLLAQAIEAGAAGAGQFAQLALLQSKIGQVSSSAASARRALALEPGHVRAWCLLAAAEERMNHLEAAVAAAEKAAALGPEREEPVLVAARLLRRRGELSSARAHLERLLAAPAPPGMRSAAWHELGIVLDRLGAGEEAWAAFERAGEEDARSEGFGRIEHGLAGRRVAAYRAGLAGVLRRARAEPGTAAPRPAPRFLVGFPRSGTTMIEQVLAAHEAIVTSDEKPMLLAVVDELIASSGDREDLTAALADLDGEDLRHLRGVYWRQAERVLGRGLEGCVLVDKNPLNLIDLALVNVVFPEARVIVALRDPRDVCLSCFMQHFQLNPAMANFLTIEGTCAFYAQVMDLWLALRERLTLPWLEVRYEETVRDLPATARRLLEFVGVPWQERVLHFHERARERVISTPSYTQVTESVHIRAIGRWRRYAGHLQPHLPALEHFVEAFGYARGPEPGAPEAGP